MVLTEAFCNTCTDFHMEKTALVVQNYLTTQDKGSKKLEL